MKKKIKTWLIHRLGGLTVAESKASDKAGLQSGTYVTLISLKLFADRMNGLPAEEWSRRMYQHITDSIKQMEGGADHESERAQA